MYSRISGLGLVAPAQETINLLTGGGGSPNPNAVAITNKWYNWYLGRAADSAGAAWWPKQINADGVANAWMNFSASAEPVQKGATQKAQLYQSLGYGGPTDPPPSGTSALTAPSTSLTYSQLYGSQLATSAPGAPGSPVSTPTAGATVAQASVLGGMSSSTLLLVGGGLLVAFLLMRRKPGQAS